MAEFFGIVAGVITLVLLWGHLFDDWDQFKLGVKAYMTPSAIATATGRWREQFWPGVRFFAWIAAGSLVGFGVWWAIAKFTV